MEILQRMVGHISRRGIFLSRATIEAELSTIQTSGLRRIQPRLPDSRSYREQWLLLKRSDLEEALRRTDAGKIDAFCLPYVDIKLALEEMDNRCLKTAEYANRKIDSKAVMRADEELYSRVLWGGTTWSFRN